MEKSKVKAISPLLAAVILVAIAMTIAIIVTSSISGITLAEREKTSSLQRCTGAGIIIQDASCKNNNLKVVIFNSGNVELSNFTLYVKINGEIILNTTPLHANSILSPGDVLTLETYVSKSGEVEKIQVYSRSCPGVYSEITNRTIKINC